MIPNKFYTVCFKPFSFFKEDACSKLIMIGINVLSPSFYFLDYKIYTNLLLASNDFYF